MSDLMFWRVCTDAARYLQSFAPNKTGNLKYNAVKMEIVNGVCRIYIDEAIAPYMIFTNEPWLADKWRGKKNPNEGWFNRTAEAVAGFVAKQLGGKLK